MTRITMTITLHPTKMTKNTQYRILAHSALEEAKTFVETANLVSLTQSSRMEMFKNKLRKARNDS